MATQQQWQSHQTQLQNIIDREIDDVINGTMVEEDDIECAEDEIFMDEKDDHHCVDYDDIEEDGVIDSLIDHAADDGIGDATDDVDDMDAGIPSSSSCSFDGLLSSADTASRRFCPSRIYTNHALITDVLSSSAIHGGDLIKLQHISEEKRVSSTLTPQQSNSSYSHGPMPTGTSIISQSQASGQVTLLMNSVHSPPLQTLSSLLIASTFIESTSKVVPTPSHVNTTSSVSLTDSLTHSPSHLNPRHSHYASPPSSICSSPVISSDSNLTSSSQWPKSKFSSVSGHRAFFQRIRRLELAIQEREGEGEYVEDKTHVNGMQSRMDGKSPNSSRNDSTRAIESAAILDLKESRDDTTNTHPQLTISSSSSMDGNKDAMCSVSVNSVDHVDPSIPCHISLSSHLSIRIHPITNDSLNHTPGSQIDLPLTNPAGKVFLSQSTIGETNSSNSILSASIGEVELPSQLYPSSIIPIATMLSQSTDGDSSQMISPSVPSSYSNHPVLTSSSHLPNNAKTVDDACNASNSHAADGDLFHLYSYDPWSCSFLPLSHRSRIAVRASHPNCASWLTRIEAILVELANSRTDLLAFTKLSHFHHHILSHGDELEKELLPLNRTRSQSQSIDPIIHSASLKWQPSSSSSSSSPSSYSIPFTLLHSSWFDWIRNYRLDHVHPMPSNSFTQAKQDQSAMNNNLSPRRDYPVQSSHQGPLSSIAARTPLPLPLPLTSQSSDFEFI